MALQLKLNITQLYLQGKHSYNHNDYKTALRFFYQAWIKLPKPEHQHNDAGDILMFIGSSYFKQHRYVPAIEALRGALNCERLSHSPLTLLRLGQCLWECGREDQGRMYLQKAYRLGGVRLFENEDDKYKEAIIDLVA